MDNFAHFKRFVSSVESDPSKIQPGWTHLHVAVHSNNREIVELLLDDGYDVTAVDCNGETALHLAALSADRWQVALSILERCTRNGVRRLLEVKSCDKGWTALHVAAANDAYTVASLLLGFGANFEVRDKEDKKPIDVAKNPIVRKLLHNVDVDWRFAELGFKGLQARLQSRKSFELDASICARNAKGMTMLQSIIIQGDAEAINSMLELRLLRHKVDPPIELLNSAARLSKCSENVKSSYKVLSRLCDENEALDSSRALEEGTRLLKAALEATRLYQGEQIQLAVIEETLEALQFGEVVDEDARFHQALSTDRKLDLKSFLDMLEITIIAPIAILSKSICSVYLGVAVQMNDSAQVENCLSSNPDLNVQDVNGWTPLHHAVYNDNEAMARRLLQRGADVTLVTKKNGKTPLHMAVKSGSVGMVRVLLSCANVGECVNAKCGPKGFTALHIAAKTGRLDIVKLLVEIGANFRALDDKGKLAVDLAKDAEVTAFLKLVGEVHEKAENGEDDIVQRLEGLKIHEVVLFANACSAEDCDLMTVVKSKLNGDSLSRVQDILHEAVQSKELD